MTVSTYLKKFLDEQPGQEAAVPGLGVFYAGEEKGKACVLFKEVAPSDKAFLNAVAFEENLTEEEARTEIENWVRKILQELKAKGSVVIEGIGMFSIMDDRVMFNPIIAENRQSDADFGLEKPAAPASAASVASASAAPVAPASAASVAPASAAPASAASAPASAAPMSAASAPASVAPAARGPRAPQPHSAPAVRMNESALAAETNEPAPAAETIEPASSRQWQGQNPPAGSRPNTRENTPRRPLEKPKLRPIPNPGGSGKEIIIEGGRRKTYNSPASGRNSDKTPFYGRAWFILLCVVVLLVILIFAVKPVRRVIFGGSTEGAPVEMGVLEENVDKVISGDEMVVATENETFAEENEIVARQVVEGEKERMEAERKAKEALKAKEGKPAAKPAEKPETKPAEKPETKPAEKPAAKAAEKPAPKPIAGKPAAKPAEKPVAKAAEKPVVREEFTVGKPQSGKFYIIVGSFSVRENAQRKAEELKQNGAQPTILFMEAKAIYYVSVKTCSTREDAVAARSDWRDNRKVECWIFAN